jgi:putative hydrolase of the HAD superfamily
VAEITRIFWDVGGVLLTNGWDRVSRRLAAEKFGLDLDDFEVRHGMVADVFDTGRLRLDDYLDRVVFHRPRGFARDAFHAFMLEQSQAYPETLAIVERLAAARRYLLATLNNESLELNEHRITRFGLRAHFTMFLSSCYLGVRKPDEAIYRLALWVTQTAPGEALFIDDRALNLECARHLGMRTIHYQNATQLAGELQAAGLDA